MKKSKVSSNLSYFNIKNWHVVVIISVLVALYFHEILFLKSFFWEDFLYQFYPFRNFAAVAIAGGELPLWNPYTFSGTPFQADIQSALFYIPNILLSFFVTGGKLHFYWVELFIIFHYILAGVSMYYFAREIGISSLAGLFSGIVFTFSGFMITHAIHQVIICQVAWLPLIMLTFRHALLKQSLFYSIVSGLILGHAILAGFPQISLYIVFLMFLYFVFEIYFVVREKEFKKSFLLTLFAGKTIAVAIGLTAIQLLPTLELAPLSQRAEITYEKSIEGSLSWEQLLTVFMPKFFGASGAQGSTYWGPGAYWVFWETCFYIGIPALVLIIFALAGINKNKYTAFFIAIGLFGILYALGDNFLFHKFFFSYVPGFDTFRSIGRMTLYFTFGGALLAGIGIDQLSKLYTENNKKIKSTAYIIIIIGLALWLLTQGGIFQPSKMNDSSIQIHEIALSSAITAMVLLLVSGIIILLLYRKKIQYKFVLILFLLIQFVDLYLFGFNQNNSKTNPEEYFGRTSNLVEILKKEGEKEFFRINARQGGAMILDRNQGMIDKIFLMEGYTPLSLQRNFPPAKDWNGVCDLLNAKYRIAVDEKQRRMNLVTVDTYLPRVYLVNDMKIIKDETDLKNYMESGEFNPHTTVLFEESPDYIPQLSSEPVMGKAEITEYFLNRIKLRTYSTRDCFLVMSEVYYPDWNAYIDGAPQKIYRANWNLRAFPVKAGNHNIEVKFEPKSFFKGFWITLITIGLSLFGIVYSRMRKVNVKYNKDQGN